MDKIVVKKLEERIKNNNFLIQTGSGRFESWLNISGVTPNSV